MNFKNKVVVITGASSGIGEASAIQFAKKGANIVLVSRREDKLLAVKKKITKFNVKTLVCPCDVSQKSQVKQMSKNVLDTFGQIDILVNNAGFVIYGKINELSIEEIESQMFTNYFGMIYCIKNFLPVMLEQNSGHIVNVASVGASFGVPGIAAYCATKYAMLGFSEGLKHELHGTKIGVTVVSPIMVRTNLFEHPSFENFTKRATGISLGSDMVAKAVVKAANSKRLEIVVPSVARVGIWAKHTFPFFINPIIGSAFRKQL
ncbi:MAG TPA: SDR family NAD(P)-dependent oxidoreductase, partial [Nitrosarchaeum sp.]|nr:SDR family NAD(P)-dependent oxidoreductase [Nitrosarchaeum sp.]